MIVQWIIVVQVSIKKKGDVAQGFRRNQQGQLLAGCPVDQKISQMHWFVREHQPLSAFIVTMIDNPFLCGHRTSHL